MVKSEHAPTPLLGLWHNVSSSPVTLPAGPAKHNTHRWGCVHSHRGAGYQYIIHIHLMGHTPRLTHTHIQMGPLYHISGRAETPYTPVDALLLSCTVIRFPDSPPCVTSSFIFMRSALCQRPPLLGGGASDPEAGKTHTAQTRWPVNLSVVNITLFPTRENQRCLLLLLT